MTNHKSPVTNDKKQVEQCSGSGRQDNDHCAGHQREHGQGQLRPHETDRQRWHDDDGGNGERRQHRLVERWPPTYLSPNPVNSTDRDEHGKDCDRKEPE
jgi:hypothetical protein